MGGGLAVVSLPDVRDVAIIPDLCFYPLAARADVTHATVHGTLESFHPQESPHSPPCATFCSESKHVKCASRASSGLQVCLQNVDSHFGNGAVSLFCSLHNHSHPQINMLVILQF